MTFSLWITLIHIVFLLFSNHSLSSESTDKVKSECRVLTGTKITIQTNIERLTQLQQKNKDYLTTIKYNTRIEIKVKSNMFIIEMNLQTEEEKTKKLNVLIQEKCG